ncbi:MAG: acyl-CoA dehydrogenase family protein [Lentisphaeria bacterium]|nr:acyl-CoA dehydrogenase family protein [Lentisphaeria bacterium]
MPENFYLDNPDIRFHLQNVGLDKIVGMREEDYSEQERFPEAPEDFEDALDTYDKVLEIVGEITGDLIAPRAEDVDLDGATLENGKVTYAPGTQKNLENLTQAELMGVTLPRQYGGLNMPTTTYSMMNEMVSRADGSLQNLFGLQDIGETVYRFGDESQRERYLPRFASGESDGAMVLTEPEAGSDLQAVQLKARYDEETDTWYLNGMKRFITNGCARLLLVLARSEEGTKDGRGLSMFICESGPKLVVRRIENKLGIHGSPTCELQFNDVPAELIGLRRRGLTRYVMSLMNGARVAISAQALGIAEAAYREALKYAKEREQFEKAIIQFPAVYEMLVRSKTKIMAARALLYFTTKEVDLRDCYEDINRDADRVSAETRKLEKYHTRIAAVLTPLAKAYCTEIGNQVTYDTIQIHGGTGFMKDFPAERLARDVRITNIYEGTTQLQYVAAIGGIIRRVLDPIMDEFAALPYEGMLRRLVNTVNEAREKLLKAVQMVEEKRDSEYHDLMAGRLCEMQTIVLNSYLLLRDALKDKQREALVRRYVLDFMPILNAFYEVVISDDYSMIDEHEQVMEL